METTRMCVLEWMMASLCGMTAAMLFCWIHSEATMNRMAGRLEAVESEIVGMFHRGEEHECRINRIEDWMRETKAAPEE